MFVIFTFGQTEQPGPRSLGPFPVAFLVLVIGLALGGTTGYAINPARDLGPRIAHFVLPIPGKRDSDWAILVDPGGRPARRRRARLLRLQPCVHELSS